MTVLLILSVLMIGEDQPRVQSVIQPSIEECVANGHKMLMAAEKDFTEADKAKIAAYGTQCVVMLKPGIGA